MDEFLFYPCCGRDIDFPIKRFGGQIKRFIFNDRSDLSQKVKSVQAAYPELQLEFIQGDVRDVIEKLDNISIFFHHGGVGGEGGCNVFLFGKEFMSKLSTKLLHGSIIVSDGNGSGDHIFSRMIRLEGYKRFGCEFKPKVGFSHPDADGLYTIDVNIKKEV